MSLKNSFEEIVTTLKNLGSDRILIKLLSPNDNSKNQIYLGGDFSALQMFPTGEVVKNEGTSNKKKKTSEILKAQLPLFWLTESGQLESSKFATFILYPQYPEVRMSGMLRGCRNAPSQIIASREEGRILIFGISKSNFKVICFALERQDHASEEIRNQIASEHFELTGVFYTLKPQTRLIDMIVGKLRTIDFTVFHKTFYLTKGQRIFTTNRNSCGTTLEGLLGIESNSLPTPDWSDWELKAVSTKKYPEPYPSSRVTLLTGEPDGGLYVTDLNQFMLNYTRMKDANERNFTGPWHMKKGVFHDLQLSYNENESKIVLMDTSPNPIEVASWDLAGIINHWKSKHQHAVFVPYTKDKNTKQVKFSPLVCIGEGATFELFFSALRNGTIMLDPGVKFTYNPEKVKWDVHKRTQWRTVLKQLPTIYSLFSFIDVIKGDVFTPSLKGWMKK